MSYYEDERERQRHRPTREKSRRDDYDDDYSSYSPRTNARSTSLIKRRDSYDEVDEEITRDFSPPGARGGYVRETTIRKSGTRPAKSRSYSDDREYDYRDDDRGYVGERRRTRDYDDRRDRDRDRRRRHSSDYSSRSRSRSRSRTPPKKERRKSRAEEALESLGLGGIVGGLLGKEAKDRSSSKERRRDRSRARSEGGRSKSRGPSREQVTQAIKAAVLAGAGEAFRSRKEPGGWGGDKGKRVLTAAFSAGGVDGLINHGKDSERHSTRDTIGSAIAGLATSRIVNGPRSKSRGRGVSPDSRRGRSESRGGFRDLAAGGVVAATAKKVYDSVRSRSRGRSQSRAGSASSYDSRSPPPKGSRRRSVSRAAAKGLAALGLTGAASKLDPDKNPRRGLDRRGSSSDRNDRYRYDDDDDYRNDVGQPRSDSTNGRARSVGQSHSDWQVDRSRSAHDYEVDFSPHHNGDPDTDSDSDLGSSSGEEKERKKGKRKLLITSGLATIATIHAGHSVYQSYEKRHGRKVAVAEGKISPEEAKNNRNRDRLQEAASLGIAALGLKGAYSEWKEMKEQREEFMNDVHKHQRHHAKREARRRKFDEIQRKGYSDSGYASSMPNLHSPPPSGPAGYGSQRFDQQQHYDNYGPPGSMQYNDGNPYGGSFAAPHPDHMNGSPLPPPPVGGQYYPPPPV